MRALIRHRLTYRYDAPVTLGEHRLCLKPRGQGFQTLLGHQLSVCLLYTSDAADE